MRLDKYLADMGVGTRSEVKKLIGWGRVTVDSKVVRDPGFKVSEDSVVFADKKEIKYVKYCYYMLNKPKDCVSATSDAKDKTVMDVLKSAGLKTPVFDELAPVGRLDKDTEGLLLITNDGEMAHFLISPKNHVDKLYYAETEGVMTEDDVTAFKKGMEFSDFTAAPADLRILSSDETGSKVHITIHEGKFHQVKRMVAKCGKNVTYLKRLEFGPLNLDSKLKAGNYRELTIDEVNSLRCLQEK